MPETIKGFGTLTLLQKEFMEILASLPDKDQFYLAGGTALSEYYLGHRLSFDLDYFTGTENLILPLSYQIESACQKMGVSLKVVRRFSTFVELLVEKDNESLKVDLALDSPYRFESPLLSSEGIYINDYTDLRADKLLAYFGRAEPRDAVDLYFILQKESPEKLLEQAAQKDTGFDPYWFAIALNRCESFPDQIERWPVKMLHTFDPRKLKQTFLEWAVKLMDKTRKK
ncbi:MAG TPA: nucleotidyl transferase AbiEii/AbiGii toxin family protein [Anaerolineales bacterium]|nr:nucleotidyl transferase AbiEii/AbiGii toxin family protein [Anaerolineales bacterium]